MFNLFIYRLPFNFSLLLGWIRSYLIWRISHRSTTKFMVHLFFSLNFVFIINWKLLFASSSIQRWRYWIKRPHLQNHHLSWYIMSSFNVTILFTIFTKKSPFKRNVWHFDGLFVSLFHVPKLDESWLNCFSCMMSCWFFLRLFLYYSLNIKFYILT